MTRCPSCNSPKPNLLPATQCGGEAMTCFDPFHVTVTAENTADRIEAAAALCLSIGMCGALAGARPQSGAKEAR